MTPPLSGSLSTILDTQPRPSVKMLGYEGAYDKALPHGHGAPELGIQPHRHPHYRSNVVLKNWELTVAACRRQYPRYYGYEVRGRN